MERLAQAVVGTHASRLQIFVDDVTGKVVERQEMIGLFIFLLRLVNQKLAYHKGQYGRSVDWIGVTWHFCNHGIIATIKQQKRSELQKPIANTLQENVVSSEFLQSLTGKLSDAARLLTTWRPFLRDHWVALTRGTSPGAPNGHIWTK